MDQAFKGKQKEWAKVIAKAWVDEEFKKQLLADPKSVLKENGIDFPETIKVNMTESKKDELNLTLPPRPEGISGSAEDLLERIQPDWSTCYG
jgi:hypothetical protein